MRDHLPYEWQMARCAYNQLAMGLPQLEWNVQYAAFAVYSRNLYNFLTNNDRGNMSAPNFVKFKNPEGRSEIGKIISKLESQVMHLGPRRPSDPKLKLGLQELAVMHQWICREMHVFLDSLDDHYRPIWDKAIKRGLQNGVTTGPTGPSRPE